MNIWTILSLSFSLVSVIAFVFSLDCKNKDRVDSLTTFCYCCTLVSLFCILGGTHSMSAEAGWPDKGLYSNY